MSLCSASQNAPVSARTRSRLESVLKAGIATNAGDGGDSKRANSAGNAARFSNMGEDVLAKILGMAVSDADPCKRLKELCQPDKTFAALCKDGRLYDEVNKKLGWYGSYSTLEALNASGKYETQHSFQSWFKFSCDTLKNVIPHEHGQHLVNLRVALLHPAHDVLRRQYLTQHILTEIISFYDQHGNAQGIFTTDIKDLIRLGMQHLRELSEALLVNANIDDLTSQFSFLISTVWNPTYESMSDWARDEGWGVERDEPNRIDVFYEWLQLLMSEILFYTKLDKHFKFMIPYDAFGTFVRIE
jgi:hypothetical protein